MNFLKKETNGKKTFGSALLETLLNAIIFTVLLYLYLSSLPQIQEILDGIKNGNISALNVTVIAFPIIIVFLLTLKLGILIMNEKK